MKDLKFSEDEINILARIKGKKLKSYEGAMISNGRFFMNPIKLNMPRFSVTLGLTFVPLTWTSSHRTQEMEDATVFNCNEIDPYQKPYGNPICVFPIEETVSGIVIIRDYVGTNMNESFVFDNGVILTTGSNTYSLIRYSIWDCAVYLKTRKEAEKFYSTARARTDFSDILDEDLKVSVRREFISL